MKEELKQAIEKAAEKRYGLHDTKINVIQRNCFRAGVEYALFKESNFLRHADPKVMDDAGWFNKSKLIPETAGLFFPVHCECGWIGSSEELLGGGQIADTGDYDDSYCPSCGTVEPSEADELTIEDYKNGIKLMTKIIVGLRDEVEKNHWEKQAAWVREDEWISVSKQTPVPYQSSQKWDGKRSDLVLVADIEGNIKLARYYEGVLDGSEFKEWYDDTDYELSIKPYKWKKIF